MFKIKLTKILTELTKLDSPVALLLLLSPSVVLQVELNTAVLPPQEPLPIVGEKLHQVFHSVLENLVKIMDGYCLPEPYFSAKVSGLQCIGTALRNG